MPPELSANIVLRWVLRATVGLQVIGLGGRYLFGANETESDVYGLLYLDWGFDEALALQIDSVGHWLCVACGILVVGLPMLAGKRTQQPDESRPSSPSRRIEQIASGVVFAWFFTIAVAHMLRGDRFAELSLGEHAVRFAAPLVLCWLLGHRSGDDRSAWACRTAVRLLAFAAAATFAVHGYKAVVQYGGFADLILLTDQQWFHIGLSQAMTERALWTIGVVDIAVAVWLAFRSTPAVAFYMTFWGLLTASSRVTAFGDSAWPEILIRAGNYGVPLAVGLAALALRRAQAPQADTPRVESGAALASEPV